MTLLDEKNMKTFSKKFSKGTYICLLCGRSVTLDDCYSDQGERLICRACFNTMSVLLDMSVGELLRRLHAERVRD